jgi:mannose-6-phosphate isomerase-like protein (cupin superfamily)
MSQPDNAERPVVCHTPETMDWQAHPFAQGLDQAVLLSKRQHGADCTVYLYRSRDHDPDGQPMVVPQHAHETFDDISYVIEGAATIDIEGHGTVRMTAGSFVRVPAGTKHRVYDADPNFVALNIFAPPRE